MRLYHFTSVFHLERIAGDRRLRTTESNLRRDGSGPRVVWLTTEELVAYPWLRSGLYEAGPDGERLRLGDVDKAEVRFSVEVPDAQHWPVWSRRHGISEAWYGHLARHGGAESWYVTTRDLPIREWVTVEHVPSGRALWTPDTPRAALREVATTLRREAQRRISGTETAAPVVGGRIALAPPVGYRGLVPRDA